MFLAANLSLSNFSLVSIRFYLRVYTEPFLLLFVASNLFGRYSEDIDFFFDELFDFSIDSINEK